MPAYIPSPGVDANNVQAVQRDQTAQQFRDQFLPLLHQGNAEENTVGKLNASIQLFYLAGAQDTALALQTECVDTATQIGAGPAVEIFQGSIQKVLDALNPPPPAPEQQAIVSNDLVIQLTTKQNMLAALQAQQQTLIEEIQALTAQLGDNLPVVGA